MKTLFDGSHISMNVYGPSQTPKTVGGGGLSFSDTQNLISFESARSPVEVLHKIH